MGSEESELSTRSLFDCFLGHALMHSQCASRAIGPKPFQAKHCWDTKKHTFQTCNNRHTESLPLVIFSTASLNNVSLMSFGPWDTCQGVDDTLAHVSDNLIYDGVVQPAPGTPLHELMESDTQIAEDSQVPEDSQPTPHSADFQDPTQQPGGTEARPLIEVDTRPLLMLQTQQRVNLPVRPGPHPRVVGEWRCSHLAHPRCEAIGIGMVKA